MTAHTQQAQPKSLWPIFPIALVMIALFFIASQYLLSSNPTPDEEAERAALRTKNLEEVNKDNEAKLMHYAWADKAKGVVRIPINRAMELTIPALSQNHPHPAYPVATPIAAVPVAAPATPQASPAASATPQSSPAH
ncbi:MAG: hypothetical protein ABIP97_13025 [Chthoniobacterales bacterium]